MNRLVLRMLLVGCLALFAACGDDTTLPIIEDVGVDNFVDPCSEPDADCRMCRICQFAEFCCVEGECAGSCEPRLTAGMLCEASEQCEGSRCAEVAGETRCTVAPGEACTDENCASCDTYTARVGPGDPLCTPSCASVSDCDDFRCVGVGCHDCIEGFCRFKCDAFTECPGTFACIDGNCIP